MFKPARSIQGPNDTHFKQFKFLPAYIANLHVMDPRVLTQVSVEQQEGINRFQPIFFCTSSCPLSCSHWCSLVTMNGTFMKKAFGLTALLAVLVDRDNHRVLIARAIVESQNEGSWSYFLASLKISIPGINHESATIMSDRDKCLITADDEIPLDGRAFCIEHISRNLGTNFGLLSCTLLNNQIRFAKTESQFRAGLGTLCIPGPQHMLNALLTRLYGPHLSFSLSCMATTHQTWWKVLMAIWWRNSSLLSWIFCTLFGTHQCILATYAAKILSIHTHLELYLLSKLQRFWTMKLHNNRLPNVLYSFPPLPKQQLQLTLEISIPSTWKCAAIVAASFKGTTSHVPMLFHLYMRLGAPHATRFDTTSHFTHTKQFTVFQISLASILPIWFLQTKFVFLQSQSKKERSSSVMARHNTALTFGPPV